MKCSLLVAVVAVCALQATAKVAPALTPPRGWRSWNCFKLDIDQDGILAQVDALIKPVYQGKSLFDSGFEEIGVDDGWQACGDGKGGSWHDDSGKPLVNLTRFPDVAGMVDIAHGKGVKMGWYDNNCFCNHQENEAWGKTGGNVKQDVELLVSTKMDGIKIDGCGPAHNITVWTDYLNELVPQDITVENCGDNHDSWTPPDPDVTANACTWNLYRISSDIAPQYYSTVYNINHQPQYAAVNGTRPSCWAYPDMLQVGNGLSKTESATHFAAWCVTSSPLVLGFDLTNSTIMNEVAPIITNSLALSINSEWAGFPGTLVQNSTDTFQAPTCHGAGSTHCTSEVTYPETQVWAKTLKNNRVAVLFMNHAESSKYASIDLAKVGLSGDKFTITDVWTGISRQSSVSVYTTQSMDSHGNEFLVFESSS